MQEFFARAPHDRSGIARMSGLRCEHCQTELVVNMWPAITSSYAIFVVCALLVGGLSRVAGTRNDGSVLLLVVGLFAAAYFILGSNYWLLRRFCRFRPLHPGETLAFSLTDLRRVEADRARRIAAQDEKLEARHGETLVPAAPWRCENCGEENPQEFGACWKCQARVPRHLLRKAKDVHE